MESCKSYRAGNLLPFQGQKRTVHRHHRIDLWKVFCGPKLPSENNQHRVWKNWEPHRPTFWYRQKDAPRNLSGG